MFIIIYDYILPDPGESDSIGPFHCLPDATIAGHAFFGDQPNWRVEKGDKAAMSIDEYFAYLASRI